MKLKKTAALAVSLTLCFSASAEEQSYGLKKLEQLNPSINNIDTAQLKDMLDASPTTWLIDVRNREEIDTLGGTIDAMRNLEIPRGWLEFRAEDAIEDKDAPIVVYCGINQRSPLAAVTLRDMGYTNVSNYTDGFFKWAEAGHPVDPKDKALDTLLYSKPEQVSKNVWSAIGATAPPTYANSGHNNNFSFVVTTEGVLLVNASDNYLLAKAMHAAIREITEQPVKYVVLENGQGHAMLGSNYWKEQGAQIVAHQETYDEIESHGETILARMKSGRRDKGAGTEITLPDIVFDEEWVVEMGGETIEAKYLGPAHSPGDIVVWLPGQKIVIAGDTAFHERLLPVFEHTDTAGWVETWDTFEALGAEIVIPGHGGPTNMAEVTQYTKDYLVYMRDNIGTILDDGGSMVDAYAIDQSMYEHLDTWRELALRNAARIYQSMEFE
ncbi:MAG: rhodanese-like domain-containing protein [Granulosicoccaceae bacterium]